MPEWLGKAFESGPELAAHVLVLRLGLAFAFGLAVALIHRFTHADDKTPALFSTLVLLAILIAMVTQVIGDNVARAFSLVGALSIVRFRTVVEDTRDTAFVIFSVIVGMAAGAGQPAVALAGLAIVGAAAVTTRPPRTAPVLDEWRLDVRLGIGKLPDDLLLPVLRQHLESHRLIATSTARQGAALEASYLVRLLDSTSPTALLADLNRLDGVQNVDLRK